MKTLRKTAVILLALIFSVSGSLWVFASDVGDSIEANYKPTANLTNSDKDEAYQKNYQKDSGSTDDAYLYKTAEWTDKAKGEAKVTVTSHFSGNLPPETTAVYGMTLCTAHKFTKEKAAENINFLLENYDHVDVVLATGYKPSGIVILEDVKNADFLDSYTFVSNEHWNLILYEGLYDYLTKAVPGSETGNEKQQRFPDFIYASFDSRIVKYSGSTGNGEAKNLDIMDLGSMLKKYDDEGKYCSLSGCGRGDTAELSLFETVLDRTDEVLKANCIACLMDPQSWQGLNQSKLTYWDGAASLSLDKKVSCHSKDDHVLNPVNGKTLKSDYVYGETFRILKVPTVYDIRISDTIDEHFEITDCSFSDPQGVVSVKGNAVNVSLDSLVSEPMVLTINIKVKDPAPDEFLDDWEVTNTGDAAASMHKNETLSKALYAKPTVLSNPKEIFAQRHSFVSGVPGVPLPDEIVNRIPADVQGLHNKETVMPSDFDTSPVKDVVNGSAGVWTYVSWDADSKTVRKADVDFVGVWVFKADSDPDKDPGSDPDSDPNSGSGDDPGDDPNEEPDNGDTEGDEPAEDESPDTGDMTDFSIIGLLAAGAAAAGCAVLRRRRSE